MRRPFKILAWLLAAGFAGILLGIVAFAAAYLYVAPSLPPVAMLKDVRLQVPMRIYTRDGKLLQEYGVKRRVPLNYEDIPPLMIEAFIAAEDSRFFEHPGVDYQGLIRAAISLLLTGRKEQGGSTITMQVARTFFLTREKLFIRKLREIFLALKIGHEFSKEKVLELYLNKTFLGERAYGVGAAARVYFGTDVWHLDLAQIAMIAGLPQAPSLNPIADPKWSLRRRGYVLGRMRDLGFIDQAAYQRAMQQPLTATYHGEVAQVSAPYVAEMVRKEMTARYGDDAYTDGYQVTTTLDSRLQPLAVKALREGLESYNRRHGYRGPVAHVDLPPNAGTDQWQAALSGRKDYGNLSPAVVVAVGQQDAKVYVGGDKPVDIDWDGLKWARPYINARTAGSPPQTAADVVKVGDIVYLKQNGDRWQLSQLPSAEGAIVALDPVDGAVVALSGGFDFNLSKFNRATQAQRQPGSSFKPYIYTAALADGMTAATMINDAPVVVADQQLEDVWRPENYEREFHGPTRLRYALVHSLNLVTIRVLRRMGIDYALNFMQRFGFDPKQLPRNLTLALGSANLTPLQMARGYATIANGGFLIEPYFIQRIVDSTTGRTVYEADPAVACDACTADDNGTVPAAVADRVSPPVSVTEPVSAPLPASAAPLAPTVNVAASTRPARIARRTLDPQDDYIIQSMMRDVIQHGTGRQALSLHRGDLAGKTGTSNDWNNAWFGGFNANLLTIAYVGFDQVQTLGFGETGARAALPIWINFMGPALKGVPEMPFIQPPGLVTVKIDSQTGLRAPSGDPHAMFEVFRVGHLPPAAPVTGSVQPQLAPLGSGERR